MEFTCVSRNGKGDKERVKEWIGKEERIKVEEECHVNIDGTLWYWLSA